MADLVSEKGNQLYKVIEAGVKEAVGWLDPAQNKLQDELRAEITDGQ